MLPTSTQPSQSDVVQLLPPQIPAFILGGARQSYSYPPCSPPHSPNGLSQPFWRQQQRSGQVDQLLPQHEGSGIRSRSKSSNSNNSSSKRRVPTADGSPIGSSSSSSSTAGRAPLDIVLRGITAGGIGVGAGGLVSVLQSKALNVLVQHNRETSPLIFAMDLTLCFAGIFYVARLVPQLLTAA